MYGTLAKRIDTLDANEMPDHDDEMYYKPFKYLHLGTLAYIGNSYVSLLFPFLPFITPLLHSLWPNHSITSLVLAQSLHYFIRCARSAG